MKKQESFLKNIWLEAPFIQEESVLFSRFLEMKGLREVEDIQSFLFPDETQILDPFGMRGMDLAVERIFAAIEAGERIMIFGDFDTDGITATVILVDGLKKLGAQVSYRIPDRNNDSHGLKKYLIDEIASKEVSLIITCDCGINDQAEVDYAANLGIDVIISDHHDPDLDRFPTNALAVLNPKQSDCLYGETHLSGAGIAFKIIQALVSQKIVEPEQQDVFLHPYYEVASIGTVADCVPLLGENRALVKKGLKNLQNPSWGGLGHILDIAGASKAQINEETIGFAIAPRLNAASRLGNVLQASELFLGKTSEHKTRLNYLESLNQERRSITKTSTESAELQIVEGALFQCLVSEDWEVGVLGLIGSRLVEKLGVPLLVGKIKENKIIAFSCRAPKGFNIIEGLRSCGDIFINCGGHAGAAGFSIEACNLEVLKERLLDYFSKFEVSQKTLEIASFVSPQLLTFELIDFLKQLAPFGIENPVPLLGLQNCRILDINYLGKDQAHIKMQIEVAGVNLSVVGFFMPEALIYTQIGASVDMVVKISENHWQGNKSLQLHLVDMQKKDRST